MMVTPVRIINITQTLASRWAEPPDDPAFPLDDPAGAAALGAALGGHGRFTQGCSGLV
jgi:hypothetical protein